MKTKLFTFFLALVASVGIINASVEIDGIAYILNETGLTAEVTSKSPKYTGEVVIPSSMNYNSKTYSVTSIGSSAFYWCTGLTSVTIPNSVTSIGSSAFYWCTGLTSVTIPNSVTSIGSSAFRACPVLTSVTIPNSVRSIGNSAFADCTSLTSVTIPNSVTSIGSYAFQSCTGLTSITIPNSVTSIRSFAFYNCSGLTSVTIPNSVTSIGNNAFYYCSGLTSVTIPNSVTSIGSYAFQSCTGLTFIICEAVTPPTLGDDVFYNVNKIIPLYVPKNSVEAYKSTYQWKDFGDNIQPNQAKESDVMDIQVEPADNSVVIEWPRHEQAAEYTITIKKGDVTICSLTFNAQGQLLNISFAAPSRQANNQAPRALQTATGWQYTINGLDPNTDYTYTVIAKKNGSDTTPLYTKTISFKTTGSATALESVTNDQLPISNKIIKDNQILILRDGKTYTITGAEVISCNKTISITRDGACHHAPSLFLCLCAAPRAPPFACFKVSETKVITIKTSKTMKKYKSMLKSELAAAAGVSRQPSEKKAEN